MNRGFKTKVLAGMMGMGLLAAGSSLAQADEPLKAAFIYIGPVGDGGWTYQHDQGRLALEKALGSKVKTTYVDKVPETADAERVIRELAADGNNLIFAASFGYMDSVQKVAKMFPKVHFEHVNGYKTANNVVTYEPRFHEGFYLLGVIAGKMTKTNTLGFIGSFPIPEVIRNVDAYTLGAQSVNPNIKTKVIWVDTWYDPGKERQAAETLVGQGADMLAQNTDSPAMVQVAQEKGVHAFGMDSDMAKYGPDAELTAATEDWGGYYIAEAKKVMNGTWKGNRQTKWGLKEGMEVLAPLNKSIPADVVAVVNAKKKAIEDKKLDPFQGPLTDNTGVEKVAAGAIMPFETQMSLNWYVKGIDGSIPK